MMMRCYVDPYQATTTQVRRCQQSMLVPLPWMFQQPSCKDGSDNTALRSLDQCNLPSARGIHRTGHWSTDTI